jgi:hypothetical protein
VIDVGDNAEVPNVFNLHEALAAQQADFWITNSQ